MPAIVRWMAEEAEGVQQHTPQPGGSHGVHIAPRAETRVRWWRESGGEGVSREARRWAAVNRMRRNQPAPLIFRGHRFVAGCRFVFMRSTLPSLL